MSPRRKSGLSPEDLQALKHLPAVIRALENLQEQHAKVRALMGPGKIVIPAADTGWSCGRCHVRGTTWESYEAHVCGTLAPVPRAVTPGDALAKEQAWQAQHNPILDTPERREYEAAKKAGKEVPPDLANISDAQRERMAEQRALIQAERQRKGLPPSVATPETLITSPRMEIEVLPRSGATRAPVTPEDERLMLEAVRVEELSATGNGSVGAEEE